MTVPRPLPLILLAAWIIAPGPATAADTEADLPDRVRAVFMARCAACHGPDLRKPKGRFGYVTDLRRVADNPKLVVPSKPEESRLWELVESGEMPPEDARTGAPTLAEKEVIRDWIAAGAPVRRALGSGGCATTPNLVAGTAPALVSRACCAGWGSSTSSSSTFLLPCSWRPPRRRGGACCSAGGSPGCRFSCVAALAAAGAMCAAVLGWLLADVGGYGVGSPQLLALHRWIGTGAAAWSVGVALLSEWDVHCGRRSWVFRGAPLGRCRLDRVRCALRRQPGSRGRFLHLVTLAQDHAAPR